LIKKLFPILFSNVKVHECNMTKKYFKGMKGQVKTISFLIFRTHIIYESHIYLFNLLEKFMKQYLQFKKKSNFLKEYGPQS